MAHIESRPLRIIPGDAEPQPLPDEARAKRFDYAALARRVRARRPPGRDAGASGDTSASEDHDTPAHNRLRHDDTPDDTPDDAADNAGSARGAGAGAPPAGHSNAAPPTSDDLLPERLAHVTLPIVDSMFRTQSHFLELATSLATEVAAFASDQAIGDAGNWDVQMPLDRAILPDTTLYLSLSRFRLSLRFDTPDADTKQLLLHHSALLERELDQLLRAWGTPRDIELSVW